MKEIDCSQRMVEAVREFGIIPLFRCAVPGWSIQDMTAPGCWFDENGADGILGPWDWKVDCVAEGDIAYGKFLGGKAAFATSEWYRHLMNWRRSIPRNRMAERGRYAAKTNSEKLMKILSPVALDAIREAGSMGSKELRMICSEAITPAQVRSMGRDYKALLTPTVKKNIIDSVLQYLQTGTWIVVGNIERVYRGPNLTYSGWQLAYNTVPEALFGFEDADTASTGAPSADADEMPSWARRLEEPADSKAAQFRFTPQESREMLISHVQGLFPSAARETLGKLI